MKKCAVVIGVNKTGNLPTLSAAVSGAEEFEEWAKSQDYKTTLITDKVNPVNVAEIKKVITNYVDSGSYQQMIIYFAGHGILKGPNDEHWLLSGAPGDPNEAVNVLSSKFFAYNTGIPHITIVSDACRSVPGNVLITQVSGSCIFPNLQPAPNQPDIDMFFATRPGNPAYEVKNENEAAGNYKGIFTSCMVFGLSGKVPELKSPLKEGKDNLSVVFPYSLKKYLERRVPIAAEEIKIDLVQHPQIEVTSHSPTYLSKFKAPPEIIKPFDITISDEEKLMGEETMIKRLEFNLHDDISNLIDSPQFDIHRSLKKKGNKEFNNSIFEDLKKLNSAEGRASFETQTGFSVIGTDRFEVLLDRGNFDIFQEDGNRHIRLHQDKARTLLFISADGTGTPLAILPGFIGTILVENNKVINVNYVPSRNNNRYDEFMVRNSEVNQRRSAAALAARNGIFQISGNVNKIMGTASYLRNDKALDPTLGLYAAYAYAQAGNTNEIASIFEYMVKEPEPVLFDVKMLTTIQDRTSEKVDVMEAPFCPMLTQGWSYLLINEMMYTGQLRELASQLIPGLWTTFTPKGIDMVKYFFH